MIRETGEKERTAYSVTAEKQSRASEDALSYSTDLSIAYEGKKSKITPKNFFPHYASPYVVKNNCLYKEITNGKKKLLYKLCNFLPYLVGEVTADSGAEIKKFIQLVGIHSDGHFLPEIKIPINEFEAMNWVTTCWGTVCNIEPNQGVKNSIRHAIQTTANSIQQESIYSHLGWRKINGKWEYLMPGKEKYCVQLDGNLTNYYMEDEFTSSDIALSFHILFSNVAPEHIIYPLFAFMYLSPLNEFLKQAGCEPKTVLILTGKTGTKKSTLAALFLSHFGSFTYDTLPLSFRDTGNSILERLYILKDVPTVIDDFHPGLRYEQNDMTKTAQMLMRAFGDKTARGRMRSDLTLATPKPPRGNGIITAEFPPDISESGTARYLNIEVKQNDVDLNELTLLQQQARAGIFSGAMHGYIDYIKKTFLCSPETEKEFVSELEELFYRSRKLFRENILICHDRIPDACAWLYVGFIYAMKFFVSHNIVTENNTKKQINFFASLLIELGKNQSKNIQMDKPSELFIHKLFSLVDSGAVYIMDKNSPEIYSNGNLIGYEDNNYFYLITDAAHRAVKKLCHEQDECFPITAKALLRHLDEDDFLETSANGERTKMLRIQNGKSVRVMYLIKEKVLKVLSMGM